MFVGLEALFFFGLFLVLVLSWVFFIVGEFFIFFDIFWLEIGLVNWLFLVLFFFGILLMFLGFVFKRELYFVLIV